MKVNDIVLLNDSVYGLSLGIIEKVTQRRYYIKDLKTNKAEIYHKFFKTITPNYSTTGWDKFIINN